MAKVAHYYTKFLAGEFYHVYNRTVDKKPMFITDENCKFFLDRLRFYLKDLVSIYAYCLLDNHFHLLIKISDNLDNYRLRNRIHDSTPTHFIVSKQLRRCFQSYSLTFNNQQSRCGTLFQTPFKRVVVENRLYLTHLIFYIHTNAQKHHLIDDFKNWKWSSFHEIIANNNDETQKEIVDWFGDRIGYLNFHSAQQNDFDEL